MLFIDMFADDSSKYSAGTNIAFVGSNLQNDFSNVKNGVVKTVWQLSKENNMNVGMFCKINWK